MNNCCPCIHLLPWVANSFNTLTLSRLFVLSVGSRAFKGRAIISPALLAYL